MPRSHFRYSSRLDQRVSNRSMRSKGPLDGVLFVRNHCDGASGITLHAAKP